MCIKSEGSIAALVFWAALLTAAPLAAQDAGNDESFASAMSGGDFRFGFRYRYEYVNDDATGLVDDTANASTIRLRMNYRTGTWRQFSAFGEFDYVGQILLDEYNNLSGDPGRGDYPVVADPKGPDLNQLYLDYAASDGMKLRFGRQRILLDNQRFVGGVGWRQNEQTYDGVTLNMSAAGNTEFKYSFVNHVRRIVGNEVSGGRHRVNAHLLNAAIKLGQEWTVTPYYYHLDYQD